MKTLLVLLLIIPSLSWGLTFKNGESINDSLDNNYLISKPGILFISPEELKSEIRKSKDLNSVCDEERFASYEDPTFKADKSFRGMQITDKLFEQFNPLYKKYCLLIVNEINNDQKKYQEIKNEIDNLFIYLAETDYLLNFHKDPDDTDHAYATSITATPLLFVYSQIRNDFNNDNKNKIDQMFIDLIKKNEYGLNIAVGENSSYGNHGFYNNNIRLLVSILTNHEGMFKKSVSYFLNQMELNQTNNGLFKFDSKRGQCALHYNLHGFSPIMSTIWNLNIQNIKLTNVKINGKHTLDEIVGTLIDSVNDPRIVIKTNKSIGYNKSGIKTCWEAEKIKFGNDEIVLPYTSQMWFAPYYSLTNNQENYEKFSNSSLPKLFKYQGRDDANLVSYFHKFIYLDKEMNFIEFENTFEKITFDDLEF